MGVAYGIDEEERGRTGSLDVRDPRSIDNPTKDIKERG